MLDRQELGSSAISRRKPRGTLVIGREKSGKLPKRNGPKRLAREDAARREGRPQN